MSEPTCTVGGCTRTTRKASGLCEMHYARRRRTGQTGLARTCLSCAAELPPGINSSIKRCGSPECRALCSIEGCGSPVKTRGWCAKHYSRWQRFGSTGDPSARSCGQCGEQLLAGSRRTRTYCSQRCTNLAAYAQRSADERLAAHKAWRQATAADRRAKREAERAQRFCGECSAPLSIESRASRRYCSRRCINQVGLRERREERYEHSRRRRSRLLSVSVGVSKRDWQRLCARWGNRCAYCGMSRRLTMDHVVPLTRGGWHAIGNILPACRSCNSSKQTKLLIEWRRWRMEAGRPIELIAAYPAHIT